MANYHSIRQKELETTQDYSEKKFNRYIKSHKILKSLYSELFFWSISLLPMIVFPIFMGGDIGTFGFFFFVHFLFWYFKGQKIYHKDCDGDIEILELTIEVLEDIKKEKFKNG